MSHFEIKKKKNATDSNHRVYKIAAALTVAQLTVAELTVMKLTVAKLSVAELPEELFACANTHTHTHTRNLGKRI